MGETYFGEMMEGVAEKQHEHNELNRKSEDCWEVGKGVCSRIHPGGLDAQSSPLP